MAQTKEQRKHTKRLYYLANKDKWLVYGKTARSKNGPRKWSKERGIKDRPARRERYQKNKERVCARRRDSYSKEKRHAYYMKNRNKWRSIYSQNRKKILAEQSTPEYLAKRREWERAWRLRNPEEAMIRARRWRLKQRGITLEDYDARLLAQGGVCAICSRQEVVRGKLFVDHDHATGMVRGLLCLGCNSLLGHATDDPIRLRAAAEYLERNNLSNEFLTMRPALVGR